SITNLDGVTRTPGQHRGLDIDGNPRTAPLMKSELAELYPDGYSYLSGWAYEIDTSGGYTPNYDFQNHMTETDGYVNPGDYIVLLVKFTTSYPYMGNLTGWFAHTYDFFDNINTENDGLTDLQIKDLDESNTNLETYGCIMNPLQADVANASIGLTFAPKTPAVTANNQTNLTKSGWTEDELDTIGVNVYVGSRVGSTIYYQNEDDLWSFAIMYKVRDNLQDGAIGSIFIPATQDPDKGMFKVPVSGMTPLQAGKKPGTLAVSTTGKKAVNSHEVPHFDYQDFGVTLQVGQPPEGPGGVETYTATFYDDDGITVLGTVEDIISGQKIDAIDSPADTATKFFRGWSTVKGDESAIVTFPQTVNGDITYYAVYSESSPVTLIFGSEEIRAFNGDVIDSFPSAPAIEGQNFLGWSTVYDDPAELVTLPYTVDTDESEITFYPIYSIKKFTVTFDMNGGDQENVTVNNVAYGTDASTIAPTGTYTKTGYTFAGWASSMTATAPETLGAVKAAKTFYAVWTAKNYTVNVYLTEDAAEPYTTLTVTYNGSLPTLSNANKPSAQADAPDTSVFVSWVNKNTGDTVSTTENKPAGISGKYTVDGDLEVYAQWADASTFSFYIPSVENEGEWVLVGTYSKVTATTWSTIKSALISKSAELGYAYQTSFSNAVEKKYLAKWATNPEGTEGIVSLEGKNADNATVVTVDDPVTNTAFYIVGSRLSDTDVLASEDGESLLDSSQRTGQYENQPVSISLDKIAQNAPEGKEFAGYFVDEEGNEVPTDVSASYASFNLTFGQHTYYPAYQDIVYTVVFSIDGYVATADVVYGETVTVDSEEIVAYEPYTGFPVIPDSIPDIDADPSKSVELYDKTLKDWNKDGYIITGWNVIYDGKTVATLDNENPYPVNPDHSYVPNLGEFSGKHVININAKTKPLYYEATFDCGQVKAQFPDGSKVQKLWIATGTGANAIREMTEAAFGVPIKENCSFMSWQPNEPMGAEATTFVPMIYGKPVKIFFVYGNLGEEGLDYEAIYNGEATDYMVLNKYCEQDGSTLLEEGAAMVDPYSWAPYSLLMGWEVAPAYTFTNEEGEEIEFVDHLGEDDVIKGNMIYTTNYKPFEDCWLIIYDSNTSYLIGSILEGIIDKERAINELFNFTGEPAAPGKIEELVGDYTGRTIEQILSEELQRSFNANIYKTMGKDFKTIYWHEGKQVDRKDAAVNANAEEEVIIWYQFKLINFNIKKLFSREMWKSLYIVGRPVTIPKAWLDPSQTAQTLETIINVVKGLLG
ncbi:MAG: InlB B-repeat-containing protein, partial [Clostridia bacterium]|nr:InlB B-repeat-containing protein [Clostridia bacterium]